MTPTMRRSSATMALSVLLLVLLVAVCTPLVARASPATYKLDTTWAPEIGAYNVSLITAVASDWAASEVHMAQRNTYAPPVLVLDEATGRVKRSWGAKVVTSIHGMHMSHPGTDDDGGSSTAQQPIVWITDVGAHVVRSLTTQGMPLSEVGDSGVAGTGLHPLQFGNVADVSADRGHGRLFVSDGDGGVNNRWLALNASTLDLLYAVGGATGTGPSQFSSPHSVAYHARTDTVWIADRGNNRTQTFRAADGKFLGMWKCAGQPWGVRIDNSRDTLFVADGIANTVSVFDLAGASATGPGACTAAGPTQSVAVGRGQDHAHEMAVNEVTGTVYVTAVDTPTMLQRLVMV